MNSELDIIKKVDILLTSMRGTGKERREGRKERERRARCVWEIDPRKKGCCYVANGKGWILLVEMERAVVDTIGSVYRSQQEGGGCGSGEL